MHGQTSACVLICPGWGPISCGWRARGATACTTIVEAILTAAERHGDKPGAHVYNFGTDETIVVDESVGSSLGMSASRLISSTKVDREALRVATTVADDLEALPL